MLQSFVAALTYAEIHSSVEFVHMDTCRSILRPPREDNPCRATPSTQMKYNRSDKSQIAWMC